MSVLIDEEPPKRAKKKGKVSPFSPSLDSIPYSRVDGGCIGCRWEEGETSNP